MISVFFSVQYTNIDGEEDFSIGFTPLSSIYMITNDGKEDIDLSDKVANTNEVFQRVEYVIND